MKILATFALVVLLAVTARAQNPDQFVAQIYRYQGENRIFIALGSTVITYRHVLTAADPVRAIELSELRVYFTSDTAYESTDIRAVRYVHFNQNNPNIAIVEALWPAVHNYEVHPLDLAAINVADCRVHFFAQFFGELRYSNVSATQSGCPAGASWCGVSSVTGICRGFSGSPVICGDNNQVNGIVFREPLCTPPGSPTFPQLSIINIAELDEWIREIAHQGGYGSAASTVASLLVMATGVVLSKVL